MNTIKVSQFDWTSRKNIFVFVFLFIGLLLHAQDTINNTMVTELQTIQTPSNTFVAALMVKEVNAYNSLKIYRSIDNGATWDSVFYYGADANFLNTPDPVISIDASGNLYVVTMRNRPVSGNNNTAHLWVFKSADDGQSWKLISQPYNGNNFADFPSVSALGNGLVYLSYTYYNRDTSYIAFLHSLDGALTWTNKSTFGTKFDPLSNFDAVGSDLGWTLNNKLSLSYGDYKYNKVYFASSADSGLVWSSIQTIPANTNFNITKIVSSPNFLHLGIIAHMPHSFTKIDYLCSLDGGIN